MDNVATRVFHETLEALRQASRRASQLQAENDRLHIKIHKLTKSEVNRSGGFCTHCNTQISSFEGLSKCPSCGTKSIPCDYKDQVNISINWHELRILCMWSEKWWNEKVSKDEEPTALNPIYSIVDRIRRQHSERIKKMSLTLAGEVQQVVDKFGPNVQHNIPGVEGGKPLKE